jgi:phosphatidylglycerophosphatase C
LGGARADVRRAARAPFRHTPASSQTRRSRSHRVHAGRQSALFCIENRVRSAGYPPAVNLALFDFDGTITYGDTFTPFIHFAVSARRIVVGTLRLSPMIVGYKLGRVPATKMRAAIVRAAFQGRDEREVSELGARYSQRLARGVRPHALEKIRWHQAQGDVVVVVSASLDSYLRGWCQELGLALICTELEHEAGVLTGKYAGGDCTGLEKARRVRERYDLSQYPVVYAYGDTPEDYELLRLANKRYFRWQEMGDLTPEAERAGARRSVSPQ